MNADISWPERPICHGERSRFTNREVTWREPHDSANNGGYYYDFRQCSHCGSIHPADLLRVLQAGARMHCADWKYGWPHKFYLEDVPNRNAGQLRRMGGVYAGTRPLEDLCKDYPDASNWRRTFSDVRKEEGWEADIIYPAPAHTPAKWYNEHLLDLDEVAFVRVAQVILLHTSIEFKIIDGRLKFFAHHVESGVRQ